MQLNSQRKQLRIQTNNQSIDKTFRQYAKTISQSIQKLNSFTDNLQVKVNTMLKAQQTQFVNSYKNHMSKIKQQLNQMNNQLFRYQQKIQFYQNQGRLSHYIQKVNHMQTQQVKLFEQIKQKDKKIKNLLFQIDILKKLQKQSDQRIKQMYRKKIQQQQIKLSQTQNTIKKQHSISNLNQLSANKHLSSIQTFTTQIPLYQYTKRGKLANPNPKQRQLTKLVTDDQEKSMLYKSQQYTHALQQQEQQLSLVKDNDLKNLKILSLQKQIHHLKVQNKKLLLFNSKYASNLSELGQFFLKTVEQLKRNISLKRKIKSDVSLQDFCKQDKLVLLATVLSNQNAITVLYDNIFKPKPNKNRAQSVLQKSYGSQKLDLNHNYKNVEQIMKNPQNNIQYKAKHIFPSIKSKRLIF